MVVPRSGRLPTATPLVDVLVHNRHIGTFIIWGQRGLAGPAGPLRTMLLHMSRLVANKTPLLSGGSGSGDDGRIVTRSGSGSFFLLLLLLLLLVLLLVLQRSHATPESGHFLRQRLDGVGHFYKNVSDDLGFKGL